MSGIADLLYLSVNDLLTTYLHLFLVNIGHLLTYLETTFYPQTLPMQKKSGQNGPQMMSIPEAPPCRVKQHPECPHY